MDTLLCSILSALHLSRIQNAQCKIWHFWLVILLMYMWFRYGNLPTELRLTGLCVGVYDRYRSGHVEEIVDANRIHASGQVHFRAECIARNQGYQHPQGVECVAGDQLAEGRADGQIGRGECTFKQQWWHRWKRRTHWCVAVSSSRWAVWGHFDRDVDGIQRLEWGLWRGEHLMERICSSLSQHLRILFP